MTPAKLLSVICICFLPYLVTGQQVCLTISPATTAGHGSASGPALIEYTGLPASEVLQAITGQPVNYTLDEDPRIDFRLEYPGATRQLAVAQGVAAIINFVGGAEANTVTQAPAFRIVKADGFGTKTATTSEGALQEITNGHLKMAETSLANLAELLTTYRSEHFFVDDDACCTPVSFDLDASLQELRASLRESAGLDLVETTHGVNTLHVIAK